MGVPRQTLSRWEAETNISIAHLGNAYIPDLRRTISSRDRERIAARIAGGETQRQVAEETISIIRVNNAYSLDLRRTAGL